MSDELTSGLETTPQLDAHPPSMRVRWVKWDSGFRGSGIRPGDAIVAVNGKRVEQPLTLEATQKILPTLVGQYRESKGFEDLKLLDGSPLTLTVRRRNYPGAGWSEVKVQGQIRAVQSWRDANNQPIMGPGGPRSMDNDGLDSSWGSWYDDNLVRQLTTILDGGLQQRSLNTRFELTQLKARQERIDYLAAHYPGAFAAAVKADFAAALAVLAGERREIAPADLEYRREEGERIRLVSVQAHAAWDAFMKANASLIIPAFPAIDPITGNRKSIVGKLVLLPEIGNSNWVSEANRTWFTFGSQTDGWYIADAESPAALQMLLAAERYRKFVSPNLPSQFVIIARILPNPRLVVIDGRGEFGMQVEVAAAMVGDAMFIDVSAPSNTEILFAGEEQFRRAGGTLPPDSATPADVMTALIGAIKHGDQPLWQSLFAVWYVSFLDDGRAILHPYEDRLQDEYWQESRTSVLGKVYGAAVVWTGDPRQIMTGKEFPGAPVIEEIDVEIEHIGQFDGEFRTFKDITVNRLWQLQRRNGGPWRVSSVQNL